MRNGAESEFVRTRSFLDLVIENISGSLLVKCARDHRYVLVNRNAEELLGLGQGEMIGKTDHDLFPKEQADLLTATDLEVASSGKSLLIPEQPVTSRTHGLRRWRVRKLPVPDPSGAPAYILSLAEDITERRSIEQQLVCAGNKEAIGEPTRGMAHDFNNLLGIVIGNLDLVTESPSVRADAEASELLDGAIAATMRSADLTRRLLAFARRQPLKPQRMDVNGLLDTMSKLMERTLGEDIEISLDLAPDLWPVLVDPAQLEACLTILANNARDAMPRGGSLMFRTSNRSLDEDYAAEHADVVPGDYAMIEVSDSGNGMPAAVLNRIFEPFFTTKAEGKGAGLGLSMVFGYMTQSNGHINVYSEVGVGTTFKLFFPRGKSAAEILEIEPQQPATLARGELVLAVEDDQRLRRVVVRQLRELGYRVTEAENARIALDRLAAEPIDLLFTDVMMPGDVDGYELARMALERRPELKVILTSGFPAPLHARNGSVFPDLPLLSKPYRKDDLGRVLREVLDV